jgi:RNA polymerase sigma-70 factor (ECF subfamily)
MLKGDQGARRGLIDGAYERLRRLAAVILNESFPRLKKAPALLDTTDLAHEASLKLYAALDEIRRGSVPDPFRLAARRMRWLLLDLARRADRSEERKHDSPLPEALDPDATDPAPAAKLAVLYQQVEGLPGKEREVVDLLYFHGLSQPEAAALLGVAERTLRRHWTAARAKLFEALKDFLPGS